MSTNRTEPKPERGRTRRSIRFSRLGAGAVLVGLAFSGRIGPWGYAGFLPLALEIWLLVRERLALRRKGAGKSDVSRDVIEPPEQR